MMALTPLKFRWLSVCVCECELFAPFEVRISIFVIFCTVYDCSVVQLLFEILVKLYRKLIKSDI